MVGLDPTIHEHRSTQVFMDPRVKPEGDGGGGGAGRNGPPGFSARASRLASGRWPDYAQRHGFSGSELLAMAPRVLNAPC
jgi:hypothetical protein